MFLDYELLPNSEITETGSIPSMYFMSISHLRVTNWKKKLLIIIQSMLNILKNLEQNNTQI